MRVIALVHKEEGSVFGVSFPDFPGCIAAGGTLDAALTSATEALNFHLAGMREDGEAVPQARSLEALRGEAAFAEDFADAALATTVPAACPKR